MKRFLKWCAALAVCLLAAEVVARLDDWIFQATPFFASPDRERDLIVHDERGVHGRPNGQFKKYKLNEFGFRGPPISKEKPNGVVRIMVLGASESFGLYESEDHEFPALMAQALQPPPKVEVINAAIAGMALPTLLEYWEKWARDFHPDIVVIYPSPQFYLDNEVPKAAQPPAASPSESMRSRFLERLKDTAKQSDLIKAARVSWILRRELADRDDSWFFRSVPKDRLSAYVHDVLVLASAVRRTGATPVLVTHAFKMPLEIEDGDLRELNAYRIFFPRAEPGVLPVFDDAANKEMIRRAEGNDFWEIPSIDVIDAAAELNGHRELFADPTHFNDKGSKALADILARDLLPLLKQYERKLEGAR